VLNLNLDDQSAAKERGYSMTDLTSFRKRRPSLGWADCRWTNRTDCTQQNLQLFARDV